VKQLPRTLPTNLSATRALFVVWFVLLSGNGEALEFENAGFELDIDSNGTSTGWNINASNQSVDQDFEVRSEGTASLRISSPTPGDTIARQPIPASWVRTSAVRFSGLIKTDNIQGTATLFAVVSDKSGRIFLDDMRDRPVQGTTEWQAVEVHIPRLLDAESVEIGVLVIGSGTAWFDALELESLQMGEAMSDVARDYLNRALDIMEQRSIYRSDADWPVLRQNVEAAAAGSRTTEDTYPAIRYALRKLGDVHSSLITPEIATELSAAGPDATTLPPLEPATGQIIQGRFAYLVVPSVKGSNPERMTQYVDELHTLVARLDAEQPCGWMVDLRQNHGGNVFPMMAGVGPILGEGDAGGVIAVDGSEVFFSYSMGRSGKAAASGEPYVLVSPMPPVAVLLGPQTASSGEALALGFVGRPATMTFGNATAGYTTGNVPLPLEDGARLNLAVTRMMDRNGVVYGGPIEPDMPVVDNGSDEPESDTVVLEALDWLSSLQDCE
jgi:C-terminal processing protease CtpA/Prc